MLANEDRHRWRRVILKMPSKELPAAQKNVLIALSDFADFRDGTNAHPGEELLADICDVSIPTVRRAVAAGRRYGFIEQTAPANPRAFKSAVYQLTLPAALAIPRDQRRSVNGGSRDQRRSVNDASRDHQRSLEDVSRDQNETVLGITGDTPPKPYTNTLGVLRNSGTSPESVRSAHTIDPPSKFCDQHPQGTRNRCPDCANARTAFEAWRDAETERDVEIELATKNAQRQRRKQREACPDCRDSNGQVLAGEDHRGNDRWVWCDHPRLHLQLVAGDD